MGFRPIDSGGGGGGGSGTVTNTGTLTLNQLVIGNGGVDIKVLGTLGTTTTLLHGNAGGAPTFGAVSLTADVSGDLPFSSLVQASGASVLAGRGSAGGAGDFQEITLGSGLTMTGTVLSSSSGAGTVTNTGTLTANQLVIGNGGVDIKVLGSLGTTTTVLHGNAAGAPTFAAISLSADVSGTLPVANGGTGIASYAVGDLLYASAATTLSQLADVAVGSYLRSGGVTTAPLWSTTTLPNAATQGDLLHASAANVYSNLAAVAAGQVLISAGTSTAPAWSSAVTLTQGTIAASTIQLNGTVTLNNGAVNFEVWKLNVTNTASASVVLFRTQVASTDIFAISATGVFFGNSVSKYDSSTNSFTVGTTDTTGTVLGTVKAVRFVTFGTGQLNMASATNASADVGLGRAAAGRFEVNSTTGGTFRDLIARQLFAGGDNAGLASSTSLTNATNTTVTNTYVVNGGQTAATANTGWIKIYVGTVASWIPYWSNATP